jgi:hypothetical protein
MNRVEVEPLSEARWARIEQSLMQRLEEMPPASRPPDAVKPGKRVAPRMLALASAAAFAMVAAIALFVTKPWASFHESTSRVATEASPSHVTIGEASIDLSPETGIVVREEEHATVLVLERGEVALHVSPRPKDRPFLVEAGEVHVRVVGTEFSVRRAGVSAVVTVRRGVVEVTAHGELARLKAGDAWPEGTSALLAASPAGAAPAPINVAPPSPPPPATPWAATGATRSDATAAHTPATTRAASMRPTGGSVAATATRAVSAPASAPASAPPTQTIDSPASAVPAPPAATATQASPPPSSTEPSAQQRYESAERIERKDPDGALRAYLALARGDDAWAQDALFAAGRLQADRGAHADATRLLEEYLRRFPRGSNAQDARALRDSLR